MLLAAHHKLQSDAFVAGEERQVAVRGRRSDDLEAAPLLEAPEGGDQVRVDRPEQRLQAVEPRLPERDQRHDARLAGRGQLRRGLVAGGKALGEEGVHLAREGRARQLVRQHRRESDCHRRRGSLGGELLEPLQEREIRVQRGLAQPVAAVRPAPVIQDVGEMTMEGEDEVHHSSASARRYRARYCSAERSQPNCRLIASRTSFRHAGRSA